jgi:hypothetical protein
VLNMLSGGGGRSHDRLVDDPSERSWKGYTGSLKSHWTKIEKIAG